MATLNTFESDALHHPDVMAGFAATLEAGAGQPAATAAGVGHVTLNPIEVAALQRADVRAGFDAHELLATLGGWFREARLEAGLTQGELQQASGVDQADISRIEQGQNERGPSIVRLARLARGCGYRLRMELVREDSAVAVDQRLFEY